MGLHNIYALCILDCSPGYTPAEVDPDEMLDFVIDCLVAVGEFCWRRGVDPEPIAEKLAKQYDVGIDAKEFYADMKSDALKDERQNVANIRPDYGLAMLERYGIPEGVTVSFADFALPHISYIGSGSFSTLVGLDIDNVTHALSVDFSAELLGRILSFVNDGKAQEVLDWTAAGCKPTTLELDEPIHFSVVCKFGSIQDNEKERYVPLIAQEVEALGGFYPMEYTAGAKPVQTSLDF